MLIDEDQGQSGKQAAGREGFQRLVADVSLGKIGLVIGTEVTRLSRNCADWHRLLELCALSDTLIAEADGVYNPRNFNGRLLLGGVLWSLKSRFGAEISALSSRCRAAISGVAE